MSPIARQMHGIHRPMACLLLLCLLLSGCSLPAVGARTNPSARPTSAPPGATPAPPTPTPAPASRILRVEDQAAALLPEFVGDLAQAPAWDRYSITATLLPDALTLTGEMRVEVFNRETQPYTTLYFRLYPNHPYFGGSLLVDNDVRVDGQPVAFATEQDGTLLRLDLHQPLPPGSSAVVQMRFATRTRQNSSGTTYGAFNRENGIWALASFYPTLARRFAGAWDRRPLMNGQGDLAVTATALYEVAIDTPPDWTLIATGVRTTQQQLDHGPRRDRFVSGPQRDFFLAAVRGLDQASTTVDGTRVVAYYPPNLQANGQRSLEIAAQSLRTFNARFGRYPLAELEVFPAALTLFIGVEYPGVILIEERLYAGGGATFETTVIHEVGHQWWYSLVGNDVQGEPWLDEGLTSYMQVIAYEGQGNRAAAEREVEQFRRAYRSARAANQDAPLGLAVGDYRGNYFSIVYAKGALFFHALRQRLGDEVFFRFLQDYYATYRYGAATGPDLLARAEAACGCDLQAFYTAWVNEAAAVEIP